VGVGEIKVKRGYGINKKSRKGKQGHQNQSNQIEEKSFLFQKHPQLNFSPIANHYYNSSTTESLGVSNGWCPEMGFG
jgi:hypothetical protein